MQANDLTPAIDVDRNGDYRRDRDDPATRPDLEVSSVEPQVRPFASEGSVEKTIHTLVDVLAQLADRRFGDAGHAHRLDQLVDPAGGDAADPGLL